MFKSEFYLIKGDLLILKLIDTFPQKEEELPFYYWSIIVKATSEEVGKISLRLGHNYHSYYNGNIGYEIDEKYRGNHYSYLDKTEWVRLSNVKYCRCPKSLIRFCTKRLIQHRLGLRVRSFLVSRTRRH